MYNNQYMLDNLTRQRERIDEMIRSYQQPQPVNNFITTTQIPPREHVEWRILNENEEVDNLYVQNKTLFINDKTMILKGVDGSLEKWDIKKTYPIDEKDQKINALEQEVKKLKEVLNDEHTKSNSTARECVKPNDNVNGYVEPKSKTASKPISK